MQIKPLLETYLEKTAHQRDGSTNNLFISLNKPHQPISTVTVRNSFIEAMAKAKIDINKFGPHSARSSASSAPGLSLKEILSMGCWQQASTYRRFYSADVQE